MSRRDRLQLLYLNIIYWLGLGVFEAIGFFPGATLKNAMFKGVSQWDDSVIMEYWKLVYKDVLPKYLVLMVLGVLVILLFIFVKDLSKTKLWLVIALGSLIYAVTQIYILEQLDLSRGLKISTLMDANAGVLFIFSMVLNASLAYWLFIIALFGFTYFKRFKQERIINLELENSLNEARYESLVYQLRPHFLFNVLNSTSMLVRANKNKKAVEMITGISDLLRSTLDDKRGQLIPLKEELELTEKYLDLEAKLYSDHLTIRKNLDSSCDRIEVPHLLLQPLIENAFKHGVSKLTSECVIEISSGLEGKFLKLEIVNSAPSLPKDWKWQAHKGIGLTNVDNRLNSIYGSSYEFDVENFGDQMVKVIIKIPAGNEKN